MKLRAGDVVIHDHTDETWVLASVSPDGREVCPAGWPETIARAKDCFLRRAATDEEHRAMLEKAALFGGSTRRHWAYLNLCDLNQDFIGAGI